PSTVKVLFDMRSSTVEGKTCPTCASLPRRGGWTDSLESIRRTLNGVPEALRIVRDGIPRGEEVGAQGLRQALAGAMRLQVVRVIDHVPDRLLEPLARELQVRGRAGAGARLLGILCLRQVLDELRPRGSEVGLAGGHLGEQRDESAVDRGERRCDGLAATIPSGERRGRRWAMGRRGRARRGGTRG